MPAGVVPTGPGQCGEASAGYVAGFRPAQPWGNVMPGKLDGKVALITGGGTGIGLATAREFAREGARVYITGRRKRGLDAAAASIGPGVTAIQGDVTKPRDLDRIYGQIGQEQGRVDIVFANAATLERVRFGSITEEHVDRVFGTNVKGLLFTAQKALPLMPDGGTIILAGSDVSIKGYPSQGVYPATKAAVRSFARTWTTDPEGPRHPGERGQPGPGRHGNARRPPEGDGDAPRPARGDGGGGLAGQHGTPGPPRRNSQDRHVPRLRRRQLHHWRRSLRRWRERSGLSGLS
jgi:short chain dehydrogenase